MDAKLFDDQNITEQIQNVWSQLQRQKRYFSNATTWWDGCCKKRISRFLKWAQAERRREHREMQDYYYDCIYEILQLPDPEKTLRPILNSLKAKIVRLQNTKLQRILNDNNQAERIEGEQPTTYNVLQVKNRREERTIYALEDTEGTMQTTPTGIVRTMTTYLKERYDGIAVDPESIQKLLEGMTVSQQTTYKGALEKPFEQDEFLHAIRAGERMKAPGRDGIVPEFYLRNWNTIRADMYDIYNQMYWEG
jgi:hypothetical protein